MTVNTKAVEGRREVRFNSYDDLLAEVDKLTSIDVELIGNWSLAQILKHLADGINASIDGFSFEGSFFMKIIMRVMRMKKKFIYDSIPSGFTIPKAGEAQFKPDDSVAIDDAATELRHAIARVKSDSTRVKHPFFGNLTEEEWENFTLRHAEMHLSFVIPKSE